MLKRFSFRREKQDKDFKHIAPGLIPAASIAPKAAVPRTPPPRSPNPSPERPRSALAAAILSSSLTGQTWAIPPALPRSFSETEQSETFTSEPNFSTALYARDRWSEDRASRSHLSSPEHSEGELEDREEDVDNREDGEEEHVYQTLDRREHLGVSERVRDLPVEAKSRTPLPAQMSDRRVPSPDFTEESSDHSPEATGKKESVRKSPENWKEDVPFRSLPPIPTTDHPRRRKSSKHLTHSSPDPSKIYSEVQKSKTRKGDEQKMLEKRLEHLEREISQGRASAIQSSSAGSQTELQTLRQQAQELVDENDALKLTVHRLNVELSHHETRYALSKEQVHEDRMDEKDALLQTAEEEVKKLRVHAEEVIKENERLRDEIAKISVDNQKDCQQLQQQALLVLQENQVLNDQLEAQHVKAKANHSRQQSEVTKMSKQVMLLEAEKQRLQEELEESRREVQRHVKEVQVLQARLKDAVTWDEHCSLTGKLRRQLEQEESKNKSEMDRLLVRVSSLREENRSLALRKTKLSSDVKILKAELQLCRQDNRKAERRTSTLKREKEDWLLQEEQARHYLGAVMSVAEHISKERDQLLHMTSVLQQEKEVFVSRILKGTVRFSKLQDQIKVYRRQTSTRLAALEEAAEGRTASYQREILHLQRLLRERQEAEEKLLQSKREVEEELEVVWQAATRENQQMCETLQDSEGSGNSDPAQVLDKITRSSQHPSKHGLDFYC
ncbi:centrosomal protein of 89 kDa [Austrofundulus limnaeus]|uniref:Centrosomal protein of 89 kDa n=1 Tax=Austrofundulus limnaeus TaxID=52670 RepID=A0A2I4C0B6_AUSLI|nr:PREDICTED: centrosomal protein of 89 kDa [Austrofundulus limnaeus]